MGHRITTQSRGKGGPTYRAPSHRYKAALRHVSSGEITVHGKVEDIEHDPARHAPIALVRLENGSKVYMLITEGMGVGDSVAWGAEADVRNGNTLPLGAIPTGTFICNIEAQPNDGGKFVRSGGVQAVVVDKSEGRRDHAERQDQMVQRPLPGNGRDRCRRRQGREALRQGREEVPQDAEHRVQLAPREGSGDERDRPSLRGRRTPAPRAAEDGRPRDLARTRCRAHGCQENGAF